ncbi:3-oxo-tetronate 4-phosphate decarboxylase [Mannheimia haemolytica]
MTEQEQKIEMVNLARSLFERGYTVGGAGNLSVRLDENRILVTPTGSSLGRLEADRLSVLDMQGNVLSGDKPSKESVFHLAMYQKIRLAKQ